MTSPTVRINQHGFTMLELILAFAIIGLITMAIIKFFPQPMNFFQRTEAAQQLNTQARACMDTITHVLRSGNASSAMISTPNTLPVIPNSRIDFQLASPLSSGATAYTFYVSNGQVQMLSFPGPVTQTLGSNVTSLMFTGDSRDPAIVTVSLRLDTPYDNTGDPTHVSTVILPSQVVRMVSTQ